jgi:hypothetical protein
MTSTVPAQWQDVDDELRQVFTEGEKALQTLRQGLNRVFRIGRAFAALRQEAMRRSHSNNPIGKRFNEAWGALVIPTPELTRVNKTDRSQFMWCYEHREQLAAWWPTLAQNQRDRWGHPDTIKKQYLKTQGEERPAAPTVSRVKAHPITTYRSEVARLQEELDSAQHKIRGLEKDDRGPLMTRTDAPADIIRALLEWLPASKQGPVASGLMDALKSTKPKRRRA